MVQKNRFNSTGTRTILQILFAIYFSDNISKSVQMPALPMAFLMGLLIAGSLGLSFIITAIFKNERPTLGQFIESKSSDVISRFMRRVSAIFDQPFSRFVSSPTFQGLIAFGLPTFCLLPLLRFIFSSTAIWIICQPSTLIRIMIIELIYIAVSIAWYLPLTSPFLIRMSDQIVQSVTSRYLVKNDIQGNLLLQDPSGYYSTNISPALSKWTMPAMWQRLTEGETLGAIRGWWVYILVQTLDFALRGVFCILDYLAKIKVAREFVESFICAITAVTNAIVQAIARLIGLPIIWIGSSLPGLFLGIGLNISLAILVIFSITIRVIIRAGFLPLPSAIAIVVATISIWVFYATIDHGRASYRPRIILDMQLSPFTKRAAMTAYLLAVSAPIFLTCYSLLESGGTAALILTVENQITSAVMVVTELSRPIIKFFA